MTRIQLWGVSAAVALFAQLVLAGAAPAATNDGSLGGSPTAQPASTTCPEGVFATGVSGTLGAIGPNPIAGTATMECTGGATAAGTMGTGTGGAPAFSECSGDDIAVGIEGREGDFIDNLAVRCQAADLTGPVSPAIGYGGMGGGADGPYDCPAGEALTGLTGTVTDDGVYVREVEISCAAPPPPPSDTTTTLTVKKVGERLKASGSVNPNQAGSKVKVTLYRKRDSGGYRKLRQRRPTLNSNSKYATSFRRPSSGRCKITSKFARDDDANPSSKSKKFRC
jgi:hypothetical protein